MGSQRRDNQPPTLIQVLQAMHSTVESMKYNWVIL